MRSMVWRGSSWMRLLLLLEGEKVRTMKVSDPRSIVTTIGDTDIGAEVEIAVEIAVEISTAMETVRGVVGVEIKIATGTARETVRGITAEADTAVTNKMNERNHHVTQTR